MVSVLARVDVLEDAVAATSVVTLAIDDTQIPYGTTGVTYTNKGAPGKVIFTLPAAFDGALLRFLHLGGAFDIDVIAKSGEAIFHGATPAPNGVRASNKGEFIELFGTDDEEWFFVSEAGSWTDIP